MSCHKFCRDVFGDLDLSLTGHGFCNTHMMYILACRLKWALKYPAAQHALIQLAWLTNSLAPGPAHGSYFKLKLPAAAAAAADAIYSHR